ncbi:hypothetical protein DPMN_087395 [Dreissena polymorpha]|uniref:Uncharacterized protein n=1 Tax=Dreissena polymorpha TaxID=45954 RepID=A0A9D4KSX5_DREPO|nr:hypothetical protein DPMN_087395 [Dreissena polymorpha]
MYLERKWKGQSVARVRQSVVEGSSFSSQFLVYRVFRPRTSTSAPHRQDPTRTHIRLRPEPPTAEVSRGKRTLIHPLAARDNRLVHSRARVSQNPIRSHHRLFPPASQTSRACTKLGCVCFPFIVLCTARHFQW